MSIILLCTMFLSSSVYASDIDREMGYINSITSTNDIDLTLESTLPTVHTPTVAEFDAMEEVQVVQEAVVY